MSTQTKVIAALVVATAAGWFTFESLTPAERMVGSPDAETLAAAPPAEVAALEVPVEPVTEKRIAATEPEPVATPVPAAAPVVDEIRGRIFHAEGRAGAGVAVRFVDRTRGTSWDTLLASSNVGTRVVADAAGRVVIPEQRTSGVFLAFDPDLATVLAGQVGLEDRDSDPVTVVGRALHLAGRVVDSNHAPLSAVRVAFQLPPDFRARFQAVMDYSSEVAVPVMTDEGGRFDLQYLAHVEGATLVFTRTGHERAVLELPDHPSNDLEVVLARADEEDATLRGRVVDADGRPMVGAYVSLGIDTRVTDEEGLFGFELGDEEAMSKQFGVETTALMAVAAGHLPVERVAEVDLATGEPLWPEFVELRLGGAPLSISGRVVSSDGDPLENIDVWAADTEVLGFDASRGRALIMENVLAERSDGENWHRVRTDAQGRFRIEGLADREYRIEAMDDETLLRVGLDAVRAGRSDAVLAMPLDGFFETVAGHVLTRDGDPIPGVRVSPQCDSFRARYRGRIVSTRHSSVTGTATDENGAFELRNVPRSLVYLRLDGENTIPLEYGRGFEGGLGELSEGRLEELEITLSLRLHFQVEIPADLAVDELCVLDSNGDEIIINVFQAGGRRSLRRIPMTGELSEVMAVTDDSETLVLFLAGEEVLRQPLSLTPGEVTTVRP